MTKAPRRCRLRRPQVTRIPPRGDGGDGGPCRLHFLLVMDIEDTLA